MPWSLQDEKQSGELASLESNVMVVGCRACLRNHGHESPCETRVVGRGSSEFTQPGGGGPAFAVGHEKNNVFVSDRGRVTKVAPECLQMSWDITTKERKPCSKRHSIRKTSRGKIA